jgi:hypothetical protein
MVIRSCHSPDMNKKTGAATSTPGPVEVVLGCTEVPCPWAGIQGTTSAASPSMGAPWSSRKLSSTAFSPFTGGEGDQRRLIWRCPEEDVTIESGASTKDGGGSGPTDGAPHAANEAVRPSQTSARDVTWRNLSHVAFEGNA